MDAIDLIYSELQKVDPEDTTLQWIAGHPSLCSAGKGSWPNLPHSTHDHWKSLGMFIAARYWRRVCMDLSGDRPGSACLSCQPREKPGVEQDQLCERLDRASIG